MGQTAKDTTGHHRRWAKAGMVLPHGMRAERFCSLSAYTSATLSISAGFIAQKPLRKSHWQVPRKLLYVHILLLTLCFSHSVKKHAPLHQQLTSPAQASAASCLLKNAAAAFPPSLFSRLYCQGSDAHFTWWIKWSDLEEFRVKMVAWLFSLQKQPGHQLLATGWSHVLQGFICRIIASDLALAIAYN